MLPSMILGIHDSATAAIATVISTIGFHILVDTIIYLWILVLIHVIEHQCVMTFFLAEE